MKQLLHLSYIGKPLRLDKILSLLYPKLSRSQIQKSLESLHLNGKPAKQSAMVFPKDEISAVITSPVVKSNYNLGSDINSQQSLMAQKMIQDVEKNILYQDNYLCAINKQRGWVVHKGAGVTKTTIAEAVFHMLTSYRKEDALEDRAGIIHRLDKETSGVLLIAKTAQAHNFYSSQFAKRHVKKIYISVVKGVPKKQHGTVHTFLTRSPKNRKKFMNIDYGKTHLIESLKGREALSEYNVIYSNNQYSVILWNIKTGRTHQIRLHALHIGTPVLGDALYARSLSDKNLTSCSLMLHAFLLEIPLYSGELNEHEKNNGTKTFYAAIPPDMQSVFKYINFLHTEEYIKNLIS